MRGELALLGLGVNDVLSRANSGACIFQKKRASPGPQMQGTPGHAA